MKLLVIFGYTKLLNIEVFSFEWRLCFGDDCCYIPSFDVKRLSYLPSEYSVSLVYLFTGRLDFYIP